MEMNYLRSCVPADAESVRAKKNTPPSPTSQHSHQDYQTATTLFFPLVQKPSLLKRRKKEGPAPPPSFRNRRDLHIFRSRFGLICKSTSPDWGQNITPAQAAKKKNIPMSECLKTRLGPFGCVKMVQRPNVFPEISKSPEKKSPAPPHQNKNPKFAGFRKCQKLDFPIPHPSQNFPPTHF